MLILILGLVIFLGMHSFTMMRERRKAAIAKLGEGGFKGVYSVVSLVGIMLISIGYSQYRASGYIPVWSPPTWTAHIALLLVLFAFILFAATYLPGFIKAKAKHPMLASIKIWALAHLLANGDLGSMLLFGSFLAWGVMARISTKRRPASAVVEIPDVKYDIIAVVLGISIYFHFVFYLHYALIGVPVITVR
jgi:uncharacterized membrane protein